MIGFIVKTCLGLAVIVGGSALLVNNVPSLKANILEVVNPRVQEQKLVQKLQTTLTDAGNAATNAARDKLIAESQALLKSIADINDNHSGIVDGVVSKVTDTLLGTPTATQTPIPSPVSSAKASEATPSPCK
jgi:hypothetical protein